MKLKQCFTVYVTPTHIDKTIEKLSDYPQKYLLSPLLKEQNINSQKLKQEINLDIQTKYQPQKRRHLDYYTPLTKYKEFAQRHPHGKVHIFNYQDVNFTLAGSQWEHIPVKNLYKLLVYTRPQLIMLQMRPDQILKGFNYKFTSSKDYVEQITREPEEIMPVGYAQKIAQTLNHEEIQFSEYEPYINRERIGNDKIATLAYYAKKFDAKIMLADMPSLNFRESLCNSLTLPQLQQYFEQASVATPQNPDIIPNTPMNVAYQILPNIFLKRSDEFIATLIEYLAAKKDYKKIFGIFGNMQSDSIVDLIENRSASHLKEELEIPKIKRSVFKELTCEDMIERHAILDVMYYGNVLKECKIKQHSYYFPETNAIIQKYSDPQFVDKTRPMQMKYLHLEMLKKYQRFADFHYEQGKEHLKDEYIIKGGLV